MHKIKRFTRARREELTNWDALHDLAGRIRQRLDDGLNYPGARKVDREEFMRCVVDDCGDVFGWNLEAVEIE